tara:strand:+ start:1578 stop:2330 length:753 start_codon:yes stop_codon:yes gene_type:complete
MSHRDSLIKKNKELKKPMDLMNVGFVGNIGGGSIGWDYDDDFSTNKGWTVSGSGNQIDTANSQLDFNLTRSPSFQGAYIPTNDADVFGENFSDTSYIMRFHAMNYSSINTTYAYNPIMQARTTGNSTSESSDDALSAWCYPTPQYTNQFSATANDNGTGYFSADNTVSWSENTNYYIENIRNSATEMRATRSSSDSFNANESDQTLTIPSTIIGLKNITIQADHAGSVSTRTNVGTINQIQATKVGNVAP